ncbi:MAG: peptide chain release factor N(5)-glutamine methyltransferase [Acidobacteriota bacterium]
MHQGRERLAAAGIEQAAWEAEQLLVERMGGNYAQLVMVEDREPKAEFAASYMEWIERRATREPLQHILGHWPFLELDLKTDRRALIPRPETEDMAVFARSLVPDDRARLALDIGTGTGCIALALAYANKRLKVIATDVSDDALQLAQENAKATGLSSRVTFLRGKLLEPLSPDTRADLIVANLPYVGSDEMPHLQPEVRDHDPRLALVAADGGMMLISTLIAGAPQRLAPGGALLLEHSPSQAGRVAAALRHHAYVEIATHNDRFGRLRWTVARVP